MWVSDAKSQVLSILFCQTPNLSVLLKNYIPISEHIFYREREIITQYLYRDEKKAWNER